MRRASSAPPVMTWSCMARIGLYAASIVVVITSIGMTMAVAAAMAM